MCPTTLGRGRGRGESGRETLPLCSPAYAWGKERQAFSSSGPLYRYTYTGNGTYRTGTVSQSLCVIANGKPPSIDGVDFGSELHLPWDTGKPRHCPGCIKYCRTPWPGLVTGDAVLGKDTLYLPMSPPCKRGISSNSRLRPYAAAQLVCPLGDTRTRRFNRIHT